GAAARQSIPPKYDPILESGRATVRSGTQPRPSRAGLLGLGAVGVGLAALVSYPAFQSGSANDGVPVLDAKAMAATVEPVAAPKASPVVIVHESSPTIAARVEPEVRGPEPTADKTTKVEKKALDVSPVREVGF
ncbi:MAG TPA: hypothetical protein VF103_09515, partial [Polyangiaceae bacterium]